VWRIPCSGPGDLSGVQALIDAGELVAADIVAVMGKTEGNGCVNDFTREYASTAWCHLLAPALGCTPEAVHAARGAGDVGRHRGRAVAALHGVRAALGGQVMRRRGQAPGGRHRAHARLPARGNGPRAQVDATAQGGARGDARCRHRQTPTDVHFVQVKCPLLTSAKVSAALARGAAPVTRDSYESMGYSRGASALGVAVALGEVHAKRSATNRAERLALFSARASASAGIELEGNVVIVLGEAQGSASRFASPTR
jgi:cyanuric acid amidohydrolase